MIFPVFVGQSAKTSIAMVLGSLLKTFGLWTTSEHHHRDYSMFHVSTPLFFMFIILPIMPNSTYFYNMC